MNCKVCNKLGMIPKCPFCGRAVTVKKTKRQKLKEESLRERVRLNQLAYNNFRNTNSDGSGCETFDQDVRETIGDWKDE